MRNRIRATLSAATAAAISVTGLALATPAQAVSPDVVISEVYGGGGNSGATLKQDFIELYNRGATGVDLSTWSVQYASSSGTTWQVTELTGVIPPGRSYLVGEGFGTGGTVDLPPPDATGTIAMSGSSGKVALVTDAMPLSCGATLGSCSAVPSVRDLVGYGTTTSDSETMPTGVALTSITSASRDAAGTDTDDNANDFTEDTPTPENCGEDCADVPPPGTEGLFIHDIQGATHTSPFDGEFVVNVPGIVTVVAANRFWMQDPAPDADPATSEGILVFTGAAPAVAVGDSIEVDGTVDEFGFGELTTTEIVGPTVTAADPRGSIAPTVIGPGGRVPPTVVIEDDQFTSFDPRTDGIDFYESLEGMLVQVNDARSGRPHQWLRGDPRRDQRRRHTNPRGGIVIRPNDFNPERIILDDALIPAGTMPLVDVRDTLPGATVGVQDYSFGNFKFLVTAAPTVADGGLQREVTQLATAAQLAIGSMNLENLAATSEPEKFAQLAAIVVGNMRSPDVIAVEEVQDNDGPTNSAITDASLTFETFIAAIAAAGGPTYDYRQIDPVDDQDGGQPGGNIRVGFLFRTDRGLAFVDRPGGDATTAVEVVEINGRTALSISPGRIEPNDPAWEDSRKPLAGEFTYRGQTVFIVANHFNSKGGDDPLFGATQPPVRSSENQRHQQADLVRSFADDLLASDPRARVAVTGDINDFQFSETMRILESTGSLTNLTSTLPVGDQYTFIFEGNSQALDHILLSPSLLEGRFGRPGFFYDIVHVNSEFADQASDHDPLVVRLGIQRCFGRNCASGSSQPA
ncbi:MAG: lamin tail domain-containing protein [Geodermatophilaceae bacterium]